MNNHPVSLSKRELAAGFMMKVVMGLVYGYLFLRVYHGDDTWGMNAESIKETGVLLHDPARFFYGYFPWRVLDPSNHVPHRFIQFLSELEYALLIKTLAFFNLVSKGNYYINSIFFNAIVFWGHYWLFNLFNSLFPEKRKYFYALIFFFLPTVFWLSGIRGDGILFFFTSLLLLQLFRPRNKMSIVYGWIAFAGILIIRMEFAMLLSTAICAYLISIRIKRHPFATFSGFYLLCVLLFFIGTSIGFDGLATRIIERQHAFLLLKGTVFPLNPLSLSMSSFLRVFSQALMNMFVLPWIWSAHSVLQVFYSLDVLFFLLLIFLVVRYRHADWKMRLNNPVILTILFFSVSLYLFIGYVVPFPGAIARYKCIPELLMVCSLGALVDYQRILKK